MQGGGVGLVGTFPQEVAERVELALPREPEDCPQQRVSSSEMLLVSSYLPEVGQSLSEFGDGSPAPFLDIDLDSGTFGVRPELVVDTFLHDCDADIQAQAADHLTRQSVRVTGQPVAAAA